jgi:signal peptidase II
METKLEPTQIISGKADRGYSMMGRLILFLTLAVVGSTADLWTKEAIFRWRGLPGDAPRWWLIESYVGVETAVNIGALFGMGAGFGFFFAIASIFAAIGVGSWLFIFGGARSLWLTIAMGLVMGGILGNLYDRLGLWYQDGMPEEWKSGVRDWILLTYGDYTWPNFNIADSLLVIGAGMLAWYSFTLQPTVTAPATQSIDGPQREDVAS